MADPAKKAKYMYTLYQCPFYRSFKAVWLINELGIQDDVKLVKLDTINNKDSDEYKEYVRSVNPHGAIPALVLEDGRVILESSAICMYLADTHGKLAPALADRKDYYEWIMYSSVTMEESIEFLYWQWAKPGERARPDPEGVKKHEAIIDIILTRLTKHLSDKQFLCGDFTAADCIAGYNIWATTDEEMFNKGSLVKNFPEVKAYVKRLEARLAFQAALKAQFA